MGLDYDLLIRILDSVREGIYVTDENGVVIYTNRPYLRMLEESDTGLIGESVYDMVKRGKITYSVTETAMRERRQITRFQNVITAANHNCRQLLTSTPIIDAQGDIKYVVNVVHTMETLNDQLSEASSHTGRTDGFKSGNEIRIVYASQIMKTVLSVAFTLSKLTTPILITGESGAGKGLVAQYIHSCSGSKKPMIYVNCAAMSEEALDTQLFGCDKSGISNISEDRPGLLEQADGSTLLIDNIEALPIAIQGKLLMTLENREFKRIGSSVFHSTNFRLICSSSQNLAESVKNGSFRKDLYYRINVIPLEVPALRNRKADIRPITEYYLEEFCTQYGKYTIDPEVMTIFENYSWPGNVRELRNTLEYMMVLSKDTILSRESLPPKILDEPSVREIHLSAPAIDASSEDFSYSDYMEHCERQLLDWAMKMTGSTYKAAHLLKISQSSVVRKKNKYDL